MSGQNNNKQILLRQLPSVDALLQTSLSSKIQTSYGHALTVEALRTVLSETRQMIASGELTRAPELEEVTQLAKAWLEAHSSPSLLPLINATGVIIHTNLGRAPLSQSALAAMKAVSQGYSNLEYDLELGKRGSRSIHASDLLKQITGAEDALIVNNNASAVLLMLSALCKRREVIISRGQLVEIGGGFRIPDVLAQSGATLLEVGTTNRTHLSDYERAISSDTAAIFVAHHSNYEIIGFAGEPSLAELAQLAQHDNLPLLYDQGSGALLDVSSYGLKHEPSVIEGLQAGVDLIAFSGDKLLGGPQAGIICGRHELVAMLKKHPLARAVRADKTCLAGLSATLLHYLRGDAPQEIPVWQMIAQSEDDLRHTAESWSTQLMSAGMQARTIVGYSTVGGGSLPGSLLPTTLIAITSKNVGVLAARLRKARHPVIGRIQDDQLLLDPRTVLAHQAQTLLQTLMEVYSNYE